MGQIYSDENPHNCHHYKDKLFAPSFDMCCPISNSVLTKVVIAKHSTCKENHFGKLNDGLKHLKHICRVGKQIQDKSWSSESAFPLSLSVSCLYLYSCDHFQNNIHLWQQNTCSLIQNEISLGIGRQMRWIFYTFERMYCMFKHFHILKSKVDSLHTVIAENTRSIKYCNMIILQEGLLKIKKMLAKASLSWIYIKFHVCLLVFSWHLIRIVFRLQIWKCLN